MGIQDQMVIRCRYWDAASATYRHDKAEYRPGAVDVLCVNKTGSTLAGGGGSATGACDWVTIDFTNDLTGKLPQVKKLPTSSIKCMGCIAPDQPTSIADGDQCWVRVFGIHPTAKLDGTTDIAINDGIGVFSSTAGVGAKTTTVGNAFATAMEAYATDATVAGKKVFIHDPMGFSQ